MVSEGERGEWVTSRAQRASASAGGGFRCVK